MKKIIYLLLIFAVFQVKAQSVSPYVIASTGGYFSNSNFSVSSTFGELTMVETFHNGDYLTQGFQQPWPLVTGIDNPIPGTNEVNVYPNPSNGNFTFSFNFPSGGTINYRLYDMLGRSIDNSAANFTLGLNMKDFNYTDLAQGIYFLESDVQLSNGKSIKNVLKINIIH
jgi:type IX secretion system substrate protein